MLKSAGRRSLADARARFSNPAQLSHRIAGSGVLHPIAAALEQFHHAAEKRGNPSLARLCVRPAILVLGALSRPCRAPARGYGDGRHEFLCVSVRWFGGAGHRAFHGRSSDVGGVSGRLHLRGGECCGRHVYQALGQCFGGSNHIRRPRRACRTRCG